MNTAHGREAAQSAEETASLRRLRFPGCPCQHRAFLYHFRVNAVPHRGGGGGRRGSHYAAPAPPAPRLPPSFSTLCLASRVHWATAGAGRGGGAAWRGAGSATCTWWGDPAAGGARRGRGGGGERTAITHLGTLRHVCTLLCMPVLVVGRGIIIIRSALYNGRVAGEGGGGT